MEMWWSIKRGYVGCESFNKQNTYYNYDDRKITNKKYN